MSSNAVDDEAGRDDAQPAGDKERRGNWIGRWVLIAAILAFLVVYVAQLARGSGLLFTILLSAGAMGVVGIGGVIVRQILLKTASSQRAAEILQQMREVTEAGERNADTDTDG